MTLPRPCIVGGRGCSDGGIAVKGRSRCRALGVPARTIARAQAAIGSPGDRIARFRRSEPVDGATSAARPIEVYDTIAAIIVESAPELDDAEAI